MNITNDEWFGNSAALYQHAAMAVFRAAENHVPLAVVLPFTFLAVEELRASGELGFPWFQAGYTQHRFAPIVQLASLGSVTLVTLWLLLLNVLLWRAWRGTARWRAGAGFVLLLLLPWSWGWRALDAAPREQRP